MATASLPGGISPRSAIEGVGAAILVLFGIGIAWTARPNLAFVVAFAGQFVSAALLYLFVQYRHYGTGIAGTPRGNHHDDIACATGNAGGIVGTLIGAGENESEKQRRQRIAGSLLAFAVTMLVGCVGLTFTGGYVADALGSIV